MALTTSSNRVTYTGNGSTTIFAFNRLLYDATHLQVYLNGTLQTSGYTVTGTGGTSTSVTFAVAPANTVQVLLLRVVPLTQLSQYQVAGAFPAATTEKNFDLAVMALQQFAEVKERSLVLPVTDTGSMTLPALNDRKNSFLAFNSAGEPIASVGGTSSVPVTAFMATVLDDTSASAALTTLGIPLTAFPAYTQSGNVDSTSTGYFDLPSGTTAQRPSSPNAGFVRFNTSTNKYEGYNGTAWGQLGGGAQGGFTDGCFYENDLTVSYDYTITTNKNAMSAGPITIASGVTVTVPSGSTWSII